MSETCSATETNSATELESNSALFAGASLTALITWAWIWPEVMVGAHWHDTSEFISTGRTLSVSHPPGHPLTVLSIHLTQMLPWFDASERAHLASSLWGALGAGALYIASFFLLTSPMSLWMRRVFSGGAALSAVTLPMVWLQVIRAEVYAAQWALNSIVWASLIFATSVKDQRSFLIAGLGLGLLTANHTLLAAAFTVSLLPRLFTLGISIKGWSLSLATSFLGLCTYLFLWRRGTQGGIVGWGWIDSPAAFWEVVSAQVWQQQVNQRMPDVNWGENILRMTAFIWSQVGLSVGLVLIFFSALGALRWARTLRSATIPHVSWGPTFVLSICLICLTKVSYPFSEQNPDFSGYIAAASPALILLLITATRALHHSIPMISISFTLLGALAQSSESRPAESRSAEAWCRALTAEVPEGGTLWSTFYATHFICASLWATEGWRADINLIFRGQRRQEWALKRSRSHPRPQPLTDLSNDEVFTRQGAQARFEVERNADSLVHLWPQLTLPGASGGMLTSTFKAHLDSSPVSLQSLNIVAERELKLGDARFVRAHSQLQRPLLIDEDGAYAWALYHEMSSWWISERSKYIGFNHFDISAQQAHVQMRDRWIYLISEARWNEIDFSSAHP